jgi:hypothetical protein
MSRWNWQILFGSALLALSLALYLIHYVLFRDAHHIFIFLVADIAFLPVEVLLVTLIIDRLLNAREKKAMLNKLNMVIGAFFSEVGMDLLKSFAGFDPNMDKICKELTITPQWNQKEFSDVAKRLQQYDSQVDIHRGDLGAVKELLVGKRNFLLVLLENPNLLEHETFTDLLWAVFHLTEELALRPDLRHLSPADYQHLAGDVKRAYGHLLSEWLSYMKHLRVHYPYLFSLAMRTNPFDLNACVEYR